MTKDEVLNSNVLKKRFCKDCGLPISVYQNPYFHQRLCILDPIFGCVEKFDRFCADVEKFKNEQDYLEHYNNVKDSVINHIKNSGGFKAFNDERIFFSPVCDKRNLYVEDNDGRVFISIDMKKANFSALRNYDSSIFGFYEEWEEFMNEFTTSMHIIESKYIRQVIFGACNPKRQTVYERYLTNGLLEYIIKNLEGIRVFSLGEDEIIISYDGKCSFSLNDLYRIIKECPNGIGHDVRVDMFCLHRIPGTDGWMKHYLSPRDDVEFKCLDSEIYHQIVKHYLGQAITEDDLVFYHNGKLARFLKEIDNPWDN